MTEKVTEIVKVNNYDGKTIELNNSDDILSVYKLISADINFILQWHDVDNKNLLCSELIISNNISSKVANGDITLVAVEENKK